MLRGYGFFRRKKSEKTNLFFISDWLTILIGVVND